MVLRRLLAICLGALFCAPAAAQAPTYPDVEYKSVNGVGITLDVYRPAGTGPFPLVIWIHGGGWATGDKSVPFSRIEGLVSAGIAVASIDYRLTSQAATFGPGSVVFPAQIDDVQDAIRFLRANAQAYELDPTRFGAWGTSSGGHLAALAGTKGDAADPLGDSSLQAVGDAFGPTDLFAMDAHAFAAGCATSSHDAPGSPESALVGFDGPGEGIGVLRDNPQLPEHQLVLDADPAAYVDAGDPPVLGVHGTNDCIVAIGQSQHLRDAYLTAGLDHVLLTHPGSHTLPAEFHDDFWDFFIEELGGEPNRIPAVLVADDFTRASIAYLDDEAVPQDFDNENPLSASLPWGACNLSATTGVLRHGIALDPHPAVSSDGGSLFFNAGALSQGSRAYTRFEPALDVSDGGALRLTIGRASAVFGVRYHLLLRDDVRWWVSEELVSPVVLSAANPALVSHALELLTWSEVETASGAGADMDELDAGGELGPLVHLGPGTPALDRIEGFGLEMGAANDLTRMFALDRIELAAVVPTNPGIDLCFGDGLGTPCPCGNDDVANPGTGGCLNATGNGAVLLTNSDTSVVNENLLFDVVGANPNTFGVLVSGDNALNGGLGILGLPPSDGLRCIGGSALRHGSRALNGDGANNNSWSGIIQSGAFQSGQTRHFQLRYREDPLLGPCGFDLNTSQAVTLVFSP